MRSKSFCCALVLMFVLATPMVIGAKEKSGSSSGKIVDSGTFGIYVRGQRIATEQFRIEQGADYSVAKSEFKVEGGGQKALQTSELLIEPNGDLRRYSWHSESPEKADEVVEPSENFLIEHLSYDGSEKKQDIPYLLPHSTVILDDYFFSQREILVWRYIASACIVEKDKQGCQLGKAQFGALVPRQHTSMPVTIEYAGKEKVSIHGVEKELDRFNLKSENDEWALYLAGADDNYKLLRILITAEQTEVVRD